MRRIVSGLGLGPRLMVAFISVAMATLASAAFGLLGLRQAFAASTRVVQNAEMIMKVQEIRLALEAVPGPASAFLVTGAADAAGQYAERIAAVREKLAAYAAAHQLHNHSAAHALSAHELIAQTAADIDALEQMGPSVFAAGAAHDGRDAWQQLEARAGEATTRLDALLRNAEEDIQSAGQAQAGAERSAALGLAGSAVLALGLGAGLGLLYTRSLTRPLIRMARAADRIAAGDLAAEVPAEAPAEMGQVARAFESMRRTLVRERDQARLLAVLEERDRIGREMHDGLAQVLGFVNTKAQAVREFLRAGQPALAEQNIDELVSAAREAYADAREAISGLRMEDVVQRGLADTLAEHVARFRKQSGVDAALAVSDSWNERGLPAEVKVQLLRVAQEALTNVRKHAAARHARVTLETDGEVVVVRVEDDGRGFYLSHLISPEYAHYGLRTMRERAHAVGGTFRIESLPGQGTRIVVRVRLEPAREAAR